MIARFLAALAIAAGMIVSAGAGEPEAHPWEQATALEKTALADFRSSGFAGVKPHVEEIEKALAEADAAIIPDKASDGPVYVLTDGMMDSIIALAVAGTMVKKDPALKGRSIVAVHNPYPGLAVILGAYYSETGRFADAVRVLERGMALEAVRDLGMGEHMPLLATERALSLARLGRLEEALTAYDEALKLAAAGDTDKARAQRGRGFVLTEMGRLDEAEAAYRVSLKLEPDNKIALNELEYIKQLRAGGRKVSPGIVAPGAKPPEK